MLRPRTHTFMPIAWHVSISHPPAERERAVCLAERLLAVGVAVALDEWRPQAESASSAARSRARGSGSWSEVLLISPAALREPWSARVAQRLLAGAVAGRRRLVPVVVGALDELPAPLASRPWAEFRDDPDFTSPARLWTLVAMLRGERADSPAPDDWPAVLVEPGHGEAAAGPGRIGLKVHPDRVLAHVAGGEVSVPIAGDDPGEVVEKLVAGAIADAL
ncbi:MAG: toll/interleukin-1 receptor domain-containing protein, partial [Deltaproteobacteria bacterium]|nr:toll/interleukin-1 receptor domain-containing protein [Deltaproteobacteria bacterium]